MVSLSRGIRFDIHQSKISKFTLPGGDVYKWTRNIALETKVEAATLTRLKAVKADMRMAGYDKTDIKKYRFHTDGRGGAAIQTDQKLGSRLFESYKTYVSLVAPSDVIWRVGNDRKYAKYVFLGTKGQIIQSRNGRKMPVGKSQLGFYGVARIPFSSKRIRFVRTVDGQRAENYPMRALRKVLVRHRAL